MDTFSKEVREMMLESSNGFCQYEECYNKATEFHHMFPNTKVNQKLYPLFLQSPFNAFPICQSCHMSKPKVKIQESLVKVYEEYLSELRIDCNER